MLGESSNPFKNMISFFKRGALSFSVEKENLRSICSSENRMQAWDEQKIKRIIWNYNLFFIDDFSKRIN